jgi:VIT1/CCC1 family predicted Fe2+/Mn2+ transporter
MVRVAATIRLNIGLQSWVSTMEKEKSASESWDEQGPPWGILATAVAAVVGAFLLLTLQEFGSHVVGYLLGSVVCTGLVVLFMRVDLTRRTSAQVVYQENRRARHLWSAVLLAGIATSAVHAWFIATVLAVR